jgi:hypothetical protein
VFERCVLGVNVFASGSAFGFLAETHICPGLFYRAKQLSTNFPQGLAVLRRFHYICFILL